MTRLQLAWDYIVTQFRDPLTWRGLILIMTAGGITISPQHSEALTVAGLFFAGLVAVISKENH